MSFISQALLVLLAVLSASATPCYEVIFKSYLYTHSSSVSTYCYDVVTGPSCPVGSIQVSTDCTARFASGQDIRFSVTPNGFSMNVNLGSSSFTQFCVKVNGVVEKEAFQIADSVNQISSTGKLDAPHCRVNECLTSPCLNDGVCVNGLGSRTCQCRLGFTGANCETNTDDCVGHRCVNGTCVDGINSYTCTCNPGFFGDFCNGNINECQSNPCQFGGVCIDGINNVTCICPVGKTGHLCQLDVSFCSPSPCLNNGVCSPIPGSFSCSCPNGFTGNRCQFVPPSDCAQISLQSSCFDENTLTSTICLNMTTSPHPSCNATSFTIYTDCGTPRSVSPSGATAVIVSGRRGYRWPTFVPSGTQRSFCTTFNGQVSFDLQDSVVSFTQGNLISPTLTPSCEVNECNSSPCRNQGTCINLNNSYKCLCPPNWEGAQCTVPK